MARLLLADYADKHNTTVEKMPKCARFCDCERRQQPQFLFAVGRRRLRASRRPLETTKT